MPIERTCSRDGCDNKFVTIPSKDKKCCSTRCAGLFSRTREKRTCSLDGCNRRFTTSPSDNKRFCSREHVDLNKRKKKNVECPTCKKVFLQPVPGRIYCSHKCSSDANIVERATKICECCKEPFKAKRKHFIYCSDKCARKARITYLDKDCPACCTTFRPRTATHTFCSRRCLVYYGRFMSILRFMNAANTGQLKELTE